MYGQMGHTLKAFFIIKTPIYLLKINKRMNEKYPCNSSFATYFH